MNADTSIKRFLEMRGKYQEGYAMWHARFATHGTTTVDNCHPFQVGVGNSKTYLAHNGMLPIIEPQGDLRSDTRIFAEDLLPSIGGVTALDNPQIINLLEDFTTGSKVCILTVDPAAKQQCYLIHAEKGKKDEHGVWWSNDSCYLTDYSSKWIKPFSYGLKDNAKEEGWTECNVCESFLSDEMFDDGYCTQCGSCTDCESFVDDCLCYSKTGKWYANAQEGGWATL